MKSLQTPTLKTKLFEYTKKSKYSDILFLFHSINFSHLGSHLNSKLEKQSMIRFAIGYYNTVDSNIFMINNFTNKNMKSKPFKFYTDIRSDIINLDWNYKNITIVYNLFKKDFSEQKMNTFLNNSDQIKDLLNYKGIEFEKYLFNSSEIDLKSIDEITNDSFLNKSITISSHVKYLKKLYFLKRNSFKTIDEFIMSSKKGNKFQENEYCQLSIRFNNYREIDCSKFVKMCLNSNIETKNIGKTEIKFQEEIIEQTKSCFLISAKYKKKDAKGNIWIELFENEDTLRQIINIHLTAKCIIDDFKLKINSITVEIIDIFRINYSSNKIICIETNKNIKESILTYPNEFASDVIECLAHYSFETFNLMLTDLRPIEIEKSKKLLITEPVIFSLEENKYASSDLGTKGIEIFFQAHLCNTFCKHLNLKKKN